MSQRTSLAIKAVREAWKREQELVLEGKGTRDWTAKQQEDIKEKGKAYDDNGFAFEGQHMKSVEAYPEFQDNPDNIQFLTREEHLEAHGGSWQNATNGYYDYKSKKMIEFEDKLIPCEVLVLTNPVFVERTNDTLTYLKEMCEKCVENSNENKVKETNVIHPKISPQIVNQTQKSYKIFLKNLGSWVKSHPFETIIIAGQVVCLGFDVGNIVKTGHISKPIIINTSSMPKQTVLGQKILDRNSPIMHTVNEYVRQNGTHVASYTRGIKK